MNIRTVATAIFITYLAATFGALEAKAQFGGFLTGGGSQPATPGVSKADFGKLLGTTAHYVLAARIEFLKAQIDLSAALGLKTDALTKASEALRAVEGPASGPGDQVKAIQDSSAVSDSAKKEESERMAQSDELSDESKARFAQGTLKFAIAVLLEKRQVDSILKLVAMGKSLGASANPFDKISVARSIAPAMKLATLVPGDVTGGLTTFGQITAYAQKHKITVPSMDDAQKQLGDGP
jgi:hypothetical protein